MQPPSYHKNLLAQINQTVGDPAQLPAPVQALLAKVNQDYQELDKKVELRTQQLIASTSRAYSFLDSLSMGFVMCDITAEIVLTNHSVKQILAKDDPRLAESDWTIDALDATMPTVGLKNLVLDCLATAKPLELGEVNYGRRILHLYIAPMLSSPGQDNGQQIGAVILVEDITDQKDLERAKDEFLSIASHELRTPLTAIRGNTSLIKKYYGDKLPDKDMAEMINDIHESAIRLIDIVNDFLDVSALEQGKLAMHPENFQLQEIIDVVFRELQSLCAAKGIALVVDPSVASTPAVTADKQRIKQVIYNLVGNAVKFTDKGSITISSQADNNYAYISVTDTGRGIPPESQRLLFKKFQQASGSLLTRDTTKGTGLGLYISKLIVEMSRGRVGLTRSEQGKGSTFAFSLPRAKA
jgi:signal transduction histidine kinase